MDFYPDIPDGKALYKIIYDLAVGSLVTILFYYLVVRLPEFERRRRLKRGLDKQYRYFRLDCIATMLGVADGSYMADQPAKLLDQEKFREYFKEKISDDQERWHAFLNKIDEFHLRELLTYMEIFRDELNSVLNNTDIPRDKPYEFLRQLSIAIYSLKNVSVGYDEIKLLSRFLWQVFAGWDMIHGYRQEDIIKKTINSI